MTTLISTPSVTRAHCGFDNYLSFDQCNQLQEPGLLVVDCAFKEFDKATNDQMALPFTLLGGLAQPLPDTVAFAIAYTRKNASIFKGYLLDVVEAYKAAGYPFFTSLHVPYEAYGTPMVGSVLMLVFSQRNFAYVPEKRVVMPSEAFPGLRYHAPNGRAGGSVHAGTALMNGFLHSDRSYLPELGSWASGVLRTEYQQDDFTVAEPLRREHIQLLFGVNEYEGAASLRLCTPPPILKTLLALKYLPQPPAAVAE